MDTTVAKITNICMIMDSMLVYLLLDKTELVLLKKEKLPGSTHLELKKNPTNGNIGVKLLCL